ncbi:MAG: hypothetical protein AB8H86_24960 [Polyangiales bacterium]
MDALNTAWEGFVARAKLEDVVGGAAGAEFEGIGPLQAGAPGPRDVRVGSFTFFPSVVREDIDYGVDAYLLAQSETRALVVGGDAKLKEIHFGGSHAVPFSMTELFDLATPFAGVELEQVGETLFLSPAVEASMRASLGAKFNTAADLFGVPLLESARSELASRMRGSHVLLGVAVLLLLGIGLIAMAVGSLVMKGAVVLMLGCIPVTLIVLALRNRGKAQEELLRLPSA